MHETRFISEILAVLKQELTAGMVKKRVLVNVRSSPFSHVTAEGLQGSFKELTRDGQFKDVKLKIFPLESLLECKNCKRSMRITEKIFGCPFCNSTDINIQMDKEFYVESLEIERKDREAKNGD